MSKSRAARFNKIHDVEDEIDDDDSDDDPSFNENASQHSEDFVDEVEDSDQEESTSPNSQTTKSKVNPPKRKPRSAPKNSQSKTKPPAKSNNMSLFPEANGWMSKKNLNKNTPQQTSKPTASLQQYFSILNKSNKQSEPALSISVNKNRVDMSNNPFAGMLGLNKSSSKPPSNNNSQSEITVDSEEEESLVNKRNLKRSHETANENNHKNTSNLQDLSNDADDLDFDLDTPPVDVSRKRLKRMQDVPDEAKATSSQASPADSSSKSSSVHSTPSPANFIKPTNNNNNMKARTPILVDSDSDTPPSKLAGQMQLVLSSDSEEEKPKSNNTGNNKFSQFANTTYQNRTSIFNHWQNGKTNNNTTINKPPASTITKSSDLIELSDEEIRSMDDLSLRNEVNGTGSTGIKWGSKTLRAMKEELLRRLSARIAKSQTEQKQSRTQRLQGRIYSQGQEEEEEEPEAVEEEEEEEAESSDSDDEDFTIDKLIAACNEFSQRRAKSLSALKQQITKSDQQNNNNNNKDMYIEPCLLKKKLKHYQVVGINWLFMLHKENLNGILADEMGLGKTIQTIAFLAYLYSIGQKGPHLIVVPASTMMNWNREFADWTSSLGVYVYHGSQKEREFQRSEIRHRMSEAASESEKDDDSDVDVTSDKSALNVIVTTYNIMEQRNDKSFMRKIRFDYLILDEAQTIKNSASVRYKSLMKMHAKHKLLLTGTPLQNNLQELWSLLNFVMPHMFESSSKEMLKKLLQTSSEKENGASGLESRKNLYINKMKAIIEPFILRRLKADVSIDLPNKAESVVRVGMTEMQRGIYQAILEQSKSCWKKHKQSKQNPDEVIDLDANSDEENLVPDKSDNEETTKPKAKGKPTKKGKPALIHSPAKKLGKKKHQSIFSILKNTLMQLRKASLHPLLLRSIYTNEQISTMASLLKDCDDNYEKETLLDVKDDLMCCSDFELHSLCTNNPILKSFALSNEQVFGSSAKLLQLKSLLKEHIFENESRVLVFSQMTKVLDIIEAYLDHEGHQCLRLDGSTPVSERQELIDLFNEQKEIGVFLLSTKAGGLGINLTSADVVIFFDISFNPQVERQAEDRVHRLGQEKAVKVIKLITEDSIEENILKMANQKKELNDVMLNEGSYTEAKKNSQTKQMLSIFEDLFKQSSKDTGKKVIKPVHVYSVDDNE